MDACEALRACRAQALEAVLAALYAGHPDLARRFGERGAQACRQDIAHHIDHLASALLADQPGIFTGYALWLKEVHTSRQVPIAHLAESFELLDGFCSVHLIAAHAQRAKRILDAARDALGHGTVALAPVLARVPALSEALHYRELALAGRQQDAQSLMTAAMQHGATLTEASVRLIQPAMAEVGRLWQANRVSVAQEHTATAISQTVLAGAYLQADFAAPVGRSAIFASVEGNHHNLGLRMLSDAFETIGWDVGFLGADLAVAELLQRTDADRPELVCLSLALPSHLPVARQTAECLRAELGSRCPTIWVGGAATLAADSVWRAVRADGWAADAMHAIEQVAA